jgi:hypothetical protein
MSRHKLPSLPPGVDELLRADAAQLRKRLDHPLFHQQQDQLRRTKAALGKRTSTKPKRRRQKGGGRKPSFTRAEIAELQKAFRRWRKENPNTKQGAAIPHMLSFLPKKKHDLSLSTFARHVFRPVLAQSNKGMAK